MATWRNSQRLTLAIGLLATCCSVAHAHPLHRQTGAGLTDGLLHPLLGVDHLLAMVAAGLLAAQLGGRAMWAVPACFVGSMIAGGVAGLASLALPGVEVGIAVSVVALGIGLAVNRRQPLALPLTAVAIFGLFHGHAHGTEVPSLAAPAIYLLGFVAATIALHVAGVLLGRQAIASTKGQMALRVSGAAIALAGLVFLVR